MCFGGSSGQSPNGADPRSSTSIGNAPEDVSLAQALFAPVFLHGSGLIDVCQSAWPGCRHDDGSRRTCSEQQDDGPGGPNEADCHIRSSPTDQANDLSWASTH